MFYFKYPPFEKKIRNLVFPNPHGASESCVLAQTAGLLKKEGKMLTIITADPISAQRLYNEISWLGKNKFLNLKCNLLPDWETLPYENFSPHQDLISNRLETLYEVISNYCDVIILSATTALLKMAPPSFIASHTFFFKQEELLDEKKLKSQFSLGGYTHVDQVMSPGEYTIRGGLIDLFPMGSVLPYRIDLFDNKIESIKTFDIDSQRSLYKVKEIRILPGREFPMTENARNFFRKQWREVFEGDPSKCKVYNDIGNGNLSAGIEYYFPLFFEKTFSIFDYIHKNSFVVSIGDISNSIELFWNEINSRYNFLKLDKAHPVLPPQKIYLKTDDFFVIIKNHERFSFKQNVNNSCEYSEKLPTLTINRRLDDPIQELRFFIKNTKNRILICAETNGKKESLREYFFQNNLSIKLCNDIKDFLLESEKIMLCTSPFTIGGTVLTNKGKISFITESELFENFKRKSSNRKQERKSNIDSMIRDLSELKLGDPVVHINHGIGRYLGLICMNLGDGETEFLNLEYAKETKLYVPVSQLHVITRYSGGNPDEAPLHSLGTDHWDKVKKRVTKQIRDTAAELLAIYAERALKKGYKFNLLEKDYQIFSDNFGFEETTDQSEAILSVLNDMKSNKPMDRLICGDVGFGKTEVALRATFISVMDNKQVAILSPTTLLTEQHVQTFKNRFADWPVKIAELSRFKTIKEINTTLKGIADGTIDIVIGTHKLLSKNVKFPRLGLLIIDEEHRFGVRQKELLKKIRSEVDVLTLTATPIPRTLGMALEGLRDFSIIATAPQKRLAIKTFVRRESNSIIREACLRELKRGGLIYFLHNDIKTILNRLDSLENLIPEAEIAIAHGQMNERDLEKVMRNFLSQRINILLCTTIIETGIDVPSANTIIISRSDKFGLAQLHQLRGRVGRSHHQAYAYLLVEDLDLLKKNAKLRLEAIQQMEELGSGFYLAMHDLEIRGAGEVIGENQSGDMAEIGYQLYSDLLNTAIKSIKNNSESEFEYLNPNNIEINLHLPTLLPSNYCSDVNERLSIYKRLANCNSHENINLIKEELIDRFGNLPDSSKTLIETHKLRISATKIGISKIDAHSDSLILQFVPKPPFNPKHILNLINNNKNIFLFGQDKLKIIEKMDNINLKIKQILFIINALTRLDER